MNGDRTPEQIAADDALEAAVETCRAAYYPDDTGRVLVDYVVVYAEHYVDDDGEPHTVVAQLVRDGYLPGYRLRGLLLDALDVNRGVGGRRLAGPDDVAGD